MTTQAMTYPTELVPTWATTPVTTHAERVRSTATWTATGIANWRWSPCSVDSRGVDNGRVDNGGVDNGGVDVPPPPAPPQPDAVLLATALALGSAVLHAGWNLVAKRAEGDRYVVLWAQFVVGGLIGGALLAAHAVFVGMPASGYAWAGLSGVVHLPYIWLLAQAYTVGDFSVSYPIARGGGAALAAVGGVAFLGDHLATLEIAGIVIVVGGLCLLSLSASRANVGMALLVSLTIGTYTVVDSQGARSSGSLAYALATFVAAGCTSTVGGLATGRGPAFVAVIRRFWRRALLTGAASLVTYAMVLVAVRHAPVGYVAALRESGVVLAAVAGWKVLGEGNVRRRLLAAGTVLIGLLVLVIGGT